MSEISQLDLSVIIPCFNEQDTLASCVNRVLSIQSPALRLEIIIVDDCSTDSSWKIAKQLSENHSEISTLRLDTNQGKGAAIHKGAKAAKGEYIIIQDADLEYNPNDIPSLMNALRESAADFAVGSRFKNLKISKPLNRLHYLGNKFITFIFNLASGQNLSDSECCYKLLKTEDFHKLNLRERRFGFDPEILSKAYKNNLKSIEVPVTYVARKFSQGKKIRIKDAFRVFCCIIST